MSGDSSKTLPGQAASYNQNIYGNKSSSSTKGLLAVPLATMAAPSPRGWSSIYSARIPVNYPKHCEHRSVIAFLTVPLQWRVTSGLNV
ncbi:hypothetical protein U1Q18_037711 [Sarracenia purpurea var. burkii]